MEQIAASIIKTAYEGRKQALVLDAYSDSG